jgi:hypothetical protein
MRTNNFLGLRGTFRDTRGTIYFVRATGTALIKVGFTTSIDRRLMAIANDCDRPVELLATIKGTLSTERKLHAFLAASRAFGEWFWMSREVVSVVCCATQWRDQ